MCNVNGRVFNECLLGNDHRFYVHELQWSVNRIWPNIWTMVRKDDLYILTRNLSFTRWCQEGIKFSARERRRKSFKMEYFLKSFSRLGTHRADNNNSHVLSVFSGKRIFGAELPAQRLWEPCIRRGSIADLVRRPRIGPLPPVCQANALPLSNKTTFFSPSYSVG